MLLKNRPSTNAVIVFTLVLAVSFFSLAPFFKLFAFSGSGNGSGGTPYVITSCAELMSMDDVEEDYDAHFVLANNIDCEGVEFQPLSGEWIEPFAGNFNGQGNTISNLEFVEPGAVSVGLFEAMNNATITNLTLADVNFGALGDVGGIAGSVGDDITITNVHVTGNISVVDGYAGGLIGRYYGEGDITPAVSNVSFVGNIEGLATDASWLGGIFGAMLIEDDVELLLQKAIADVNIDASTGIVMGGVIGLLQVNIAGSAPVDVIISQSSAAGSITCDAECGGLVGYIEAATADLAAVNILIDQTYASMSIQGGSYIGGLVGDTSTESAGDAYLASIAISSSYSVSAITGYQQLGGLIGAAAGYNNLSTVYAAGPINGVEGDGSLESVGGLLGSNEGEGSVSTSFSGSTITLADGFSFVGGLVGQDYDGVISGYGNNHFDVTAAGTTLCFGSEAENPATCTGVNSESSDPGYFKNNNTNAPFPGWDFDSIWLMTADYPILRAFNEEETSSTTTTETTSSETSTSTETTTSEPTSTTTETTSTSSSSSQSVSSSSQPAGQGGTSTTTSTQAKIILNNLFGFETTTGTEIELDEGETIYVNIDNLLSSNEYPLSLEEVGTDSVVLNVNGTSITVTIGETREIDVNNDGIDDIEVTLNLILGDSSANMGFRELGSVISSSTSTSRSTITTSDDVAVSGDEPAQGDNTLLLLLCVPLVIALGGFVVMLGRKNSSNSRQRFN